MSLRRILRHKHRTSDIHRKTSVSLCLITLVSILAAPHNALAFEAGLANAASQRLIAAVRLRGGLPSYDYRQTGTVAALPLAKTKRGDWPQLHKIAYQSTTTAVQKAEAIAVQKTGAVIVLEGEASYYSRAGCLGCSPARIMANGQPLNDGALTMAIGANRKHLVGHRARVTNTVTGKSVEVVITDTGGFHQARYGQRVADLTIATKQAIGMQGGTGNVQVEVY